jgi:hypothetical protein
MEAEATVRKKFVIVVDVPAPPTVAPLGGKPDAMFEAFPERIPFAPPETFETAVPEVRAT